MCSYLTLSLILALVVSVNAAIDSKEGKPCSDYPNLSVGPSNIYKTCGGLVDKVKAGIQPKVTYDEAREVCCLF